jgi:hypothetical protein
MSSGERWLHHSKLNRSLDRSNYQIFLWPFPLFRGHVTKKQLKPVLMQPPPFRGHSGTGRWNYLDLDKLKHRKLSLVCLGFTSINVPLCLNVRVHLPRIYNFYRLFLCFSLHFWCDLMLLWVLIVSTITILFTICHEMKI